MMAPEDAMVREIKTFFAPFIGEQIERYYTAELLLSDGTWDSWPDLPIRIVTNSNLLASIAWARFDDLWLASNESLPFEIADSTIRWVINDLTVLNGCLGRTIHGVTLGRGEMSVEGHPIEIWTRLVFDLGDRWLEVFNALDENGYVLHETKPTGEFVNCS